MNFKKFISLFLCAVLLFPSYGALADANPAPIPLFENVQNDAVIENSYNPKDTVTFIVEIEGDPVLAGEEAAELGTDYINTDNGQSKEEIILKSQDEVIDKIGDSSNVEAVYTMLFNGFAIKAAYGDMEKIKAIDGVKNVYISEDIKLEPHLAESVEMTGAYAEAIKEYTGKGQLVAIIDTEFDTSHEFFKTEPADPLYPTYEAMDELLSDKTLSTTILAKQAFVNAKIPFAFDYCGGTNGDYDVYSQANVHGTHVAGVVGGKGGTNANGDTFSGVAPDAQLVLMKITTENGSMNMAKSFSALEDAVKLGVCAVNCSFGADYISPNIEPVWQTYYENARNAGVFICASAGNKARGFNKSTPLTANIDYSASGIPAVYSSAMAVAAVNKTKSGNGQISSYSSYGVSENLELKPEITAPGGNIYSSLPNDKYGTMNGTSMAAPHITGMVALMNEYFDKTLPQTVGFERLKIIENLLMSTAEPVVQSANGVPYSPRVQGAGLVNGEAAIKTPVILTGNSDKGKISLGDRLEQTFDISFSAKNLGNKDVTYDKVTLTLLTDGYKLSGKKYYVSDSIALGVDSHTLAQSLTVKAGESVNVSGQIKLNADEISALSQIFTNGFFIDGFIRYEKTDGTLPSVGIPFMGFFGDWTKATVYDSTIYDEGGSTLYSSTSGTGSTLLYTKINSSSKVLGSNGADGYDSKYIAISPNGDGLHDVLNLQLTPMRTISKLSSSVTDLAGNTKIAPATLNSVLNKFNTTAIGLNSLSSLADGDYKLKLNAKYNYESSNPTEHIMEIPFYIDTQVPEILNASVNENNVEVKFYDNKHIAYVYTYYADENGTIHSDKKYIENPKEGDTVTVNFDLAQIGASSADYEDIYIFVHDNAENYYVNSLSCLMGDIHPVISDFTHTQEIYGISFDIISYKPTQNCNMIVAFYDNSGTLICADKKENISLAKGESTQTFASFADLSEATKCKLFFWEPEQDISPIDIAKCFDISE